MSHPQALRIIDVENAVAHLVETFCHYPNDKYYLCASQLHASAISKIMSLVSLPVLKDLDITCLTFTGRRPDKADAKMMEFAMRACRERTFSKIALYTADKPFRRQFMDKVAPLHPAELGNVTCSYDLPVSRVDELKGIKHPFVTRYLRRYRKALRVIE